MILLEEAINAYSIYAKHAIGLRSKNSTVQGLSLFQIAFISIRFRSLVNLIIRGKSIVTKDMSVKQIACENSRLSRAAFIPPDVRRLFSQAMKQTETLRYDVCMTTPCVITPEKAEEKTDHKTAHPRHFYRVLGKTLEKFVAHSLQPFKCSLAKNKGLAYLKGCKVMCIFAVWPHHAMCVVSV